MKDAISILFNKKIEEKELEKKATSIMEVKTKNNSIELENFIKQKIQPKLQRKLMFLIEEHDDNLITSITDKEETLYRAGFTDCLELVFNSKFL